MKHIYTFIFVFLTSLVSAADTTNVFSTRLRNNLVKFQSLISESFQANDKDKTNLIFDNLIQSKLIGTQFDDLNFKILNKKRRTLSSYDKPVMLVTLAVNTLKGKGEIQAINHLAKKYKDVVQVVVLFWNKKNEVKFIAKKFHISIDVCCIAENNFKDLKNVALLKKGLGLSNIYLIDNDLKLLDVRKHVVDSEYKIDFKKSYNNYFERYKNMIASLIPLQSKDTRLAER